MKKVIVVALLIVGITAFAQEKEGLRAKKEKLTTEQKVDFQVKKLSKDLNLTVEQTKSVQDLVTNQVKKREAKRAEMKEIKEKKLAEMKAEMEKEQAAVSADMKKILTPEQFAKWGKIREEKKENFKEKLLKRREKINTKELLETK
jgi:biopolymer transport protein ExbB/TolQ